MKKQMFSYWKIIFFLSLFFCFIIGPNSLVSGQQPWFRLPGQEPRLLQLNWPDSPAGTSLNYHCADYRSRECTFALVVRYFYEWAIVLGGLAAFFGLLIAGLRYISSFGNPAEMKKAKDGITSVFLGLIILLGSWVILNTISAQLVVLTPPVFEPPPVEDRPIPDPVAVRGMRDCDFAIVEVAGRDRNIELNPNVCTEALPVIPTIEGGTMVSTRGYINIPAYDGPGDGQDRYDEVRNGLLGRGFIQGNRVECSIGSFERCNELVSNLKEVITEAYEGSLGRQPGTDQDPTPEAVREAGNTFRYDREGLRLAYERLCCINCSGDVRLYGHSRGGICEDRNPQILGLAMGRFTDIRFDVYNIMLFVGKEITR